MALRIQGKTGEDLNKKYNEQAEIRQSCKSRMPYDSGRLLPQEGVEQELVNDFLPLSFCYGNHPSPLRILITGEQPVDSDETGARENVSGNEVNKPHVGHDQLVFLEGIHKRESDI